MSKVRSDAAALKCRTTSGARADVANTLATPGSADHMQTHSKFAQVQADPKQMCL